MDAVAALGIKVDTGPVNAAKRALDEFAASGNSAATAARNLENSSAKSQAALAQVSRSGQLARHEMVNLSRQIQDVGVSLASGQSPFMVLTQQGMQIADIFSSSKTGTVGGAIKQVGSGIASVITPARLLGLSVVALGAAGLVAYSSWKSFALTLDDTARSVGTTSRELAKLQAVASVKGIAQEDFAKGITSFGNAVYQARNNMGSLADVFRANNIHARDFDDYLAKAANLIARARDDQQRLVLLQQMGLPATMDWVRMLSGGADGLKRAKDAMTEFAANDDLIRKAREFDETWNKAWTNFGLNARSAFQTAIDFGTSFFDRMDKLAAKVGNSSFWERFYDKSKMGNIGVPQIDTTTFAQRFGATSDNTASGNTYLADALRGKADAMRGTGAKDKDAIARDLSLETQRLGILGQTLSVQQQVRLVELSIQQARLSGVNITAQEAEKLKELARLQALGITQIRASVDAWTVETATIGMSTGAALAYRAVQDQINQARRDGRELTAANIAELNREAEALAKVAQAAENMRFAYSTTSSMFVSFGQNLRNGQSAWRAFQDAGVNALGRIADKLTQMAVDNLWMNAFGGASGGGVGGVFSGIGKLFGFAEGGYTGPGGKYEPAGIVHRGEYVFDAASTQRLGVTNLERLRGYAGGGFVRPASDFGGVRVAGLTQSLHITVSSEVDDNGNLQSYVKRVSQQATAAGISGFVQSPSFVDHVAGATKSAQIQQLV